MESSELEASVRAFVEALNVGDPSAAERHLAREFFTHVPGPDEPDARQVWAQLLSDLRSGLPDLRVRIDELTPIDGDRLAGRFTVSGTATGPLWGAPPTNASVSWQPSASIRRVNGGFAINLEEVGAPALIGLLRQLELVNPPDEMHLPPKHARASVPDFLLRMAFNGQVADRPCSHLEAAAVLDTDADVCEQCVASGDIWPSLRLCLACGFVGCCDTAVNTHMKRHVEETGHVVVRSIRLDEGWLWCYADNAFFDSRMLQRLRAQREGGA